MTRHLMFVCCKDGKAMLCVASLSTETREKSGSEPGLATHHRDTVYLMTSETNSGGRTRPSRHGIKFLAVKLRTQSGTVVGQPRNGRQQCMTSILGFLFYSDVIPSGRALWLSFVRFSWLRLKLGRLIA